MSLRHLPIVFNRTCKQPQYTVGLTQRLIDCQRLFRGGLRQGSHLDHSLDAEGAKAVIEYRQTGVRGCITWIVPKRTLERLFRFCQTLRRVALIPIQSFEVTLESLDVCGAVSRSSQLHLQGVGNRAGDIVLDGKNIRHLAVITFRPQMRFIGYLDKLRRDPNAIARSAHASLKNGSYSEPFTDCTQILFFATKGKRRSASDHSQLRHFRQGVYNLFGQAIAEVFVFLVRAQVQEGENSNRRGLFLPRPW